MEADYKNTYDSPRQEQFSGTWYSVRWPRFFNWWTVLSYGIVQETEWSMQYQYCSKTFEVMMCVIWDRAHFSIGEMKKIVMLNILTRVGFLGH